MLRGENFNYIEEKLNILAFRIKQRGKLNLLELNLHAEFFFAELLNIIFGWELKNLNIQNHNVEAIDLIDNENKIIIQVSATATKRKIEYSLKRESLSQYTEYMFKFLYIAGNLDKLRREKYKNPYNIRFNPYEDIIDIAYILKCVLVLPMEKQFQLKEFITKELVNKENVFLSDTRNLPIKGRFTNRVYRTDALDEKLTLYGGLPFIETSVGEELENGDLLDEVIEKIIYDIFIDNPVESETESYLLKKMKKRKGDDFSKVILEATINYANMGGSIGEKIYSFGTHFTFVMPSFVIIHVFRVYVNIDHQNMRRFYSVEPIAHEEKKLENGNIASTYYLDKKENVHFLIIGFDKKEKCCYYSNGVLKKDKVKMSRFEYKSISTGFTVANNSLDNLYIECEENNNGLKEGEKYFNTALDSPIIIIDPFDGDIVLREKYFDKVEWRARIKLKTDYSYFVFSIFSAENKNELSLEEIGNYYHKGKYGFPQSNILAIEYYEKAKSAEGYYMIGRILLEDRELVDLEYVHFYMKKSAEMGFEKAKEFLKNNNL